MAISLQKCDMEIVIYMPRYLLQFEEDQNMGLFLSWFCWKIRMQLGGPFGPLGYRRWTLLVKAPIPLYCKLQICLKLLIVT